MVSTQHAADADNDTIRNFIISEIIKPSLPSELIDDSTQYLINPTGRFVIGGPQGDSGLTGENHRRHLRWLGTTRWRRLLRQGPSKVDRSAAYMCRWVPNVVAAGLADRVEIQVAYAIGYPHPTSISVDCFGTEKAPEERIRMPSSRFSTSSRRKSFPNSTFFDPSTVTTTNYGHFGKSELLGSRPTKSKPAGSGWLKNIKIFQSKREPESF